MRQSLPLLAGIFAIMALSNAIVPVLPSFAEEAIWIQSTIFSAYFLGAFLTVLPAGVIADRVGNVLLIRTGLFLTLASGVAIVAFPFALPVFIARCIEGIGAGLFVSSALSWVNSQTDHVRLSGHFIAALNLGLVSGLLGTGWLAESAGRLGGMVLFTAIAGISLISILVVKKSEADLRARGDVRSIIAANFWLFLSAVILTGITGVVTALYPEYTGESAALLSIQIGTMYTATIITSIIAPRLPLQPVPTIRLSAVAMAAGLFWCYLAPPFGTIAVFAGFAVIGGFAGFAINAQLAFLAESGVKQGSVMGLYNTSTYAGLTFLPFFAGIITELDLFAPDRFLPAFLVMALITASMAYFIGRCTCRRAG
ncbi:MAG: MFS transporter [Methanomicrobiaceae archaeon]|nr:MFS transporter [Methanomicrobiaceae archaeon]